MSGCQLHTPMYMLTLIFVGCDFCFTVNFSIVKPSILCVGGDCLEVGDLKLAFFKILFQSTLFEGNCLQSQLNFEFCFF